MKTNLLKYYIAAFYFGSTFVLLAQPGTEDDSGVGGLESPDPAAPIDSYILFLATIGLIFVLFKLRSFGQLRKS